MIKRFHIAMLGVILSVFAMPATAEAAVASGFDAMPSSDPCIAGSCRVTVKDRSDNPDNTPYTVQFDCDNGSIDQRRPFVSDSGAGRPPGSKFTCSYQNTGRFVLAMRTASSSGNSISGFEVYVASRADAPAPIGYRGPTVFSNLPRTFEIVTPKRQIQVSYPVPGSFRPFGSPTAISSRFDGQNWHHRFRLWVAPVRKIGLEVEAWALDESLKDRRTISIRVLKSSAFPKRAFRTRAPCSRTARTLTCRQVLKYYGTKRNTVRFAVRFQAKVAGRWRTIAKDGLREEPEGGFSENLSDEYYQPKLRRRYRHKPIRARFAYRVIHRRIGPDRTVFFKRTRYKRIRISQ